MKIRLRLKPCTTLRKEQCQRDRLSCLPNDLLIRMLSLLPTKYAVIVCVLLKKRMVLPWITSLDFDASPICHCLMSRNQVDRFPSFQTFVDSVLQDHQSPSLTRFHLNVGVYYYMECVRSSRKLFSLRCNQGCLPDLKFTQINTWITFPLTHYGLRVLELRIHVRGPPSQRQLPSEVFTKETLEVLKLDVNLSFDGISIFRLPNLKTLHLYASLLSEDVFLARLVSSCPLLEELVVKAWWNHVCFTNISSPSLRILCLTMFKVEENDNSDLVVLDTPNLEHLLYLDNMALQYSITSMNHLATATIDLHYPLHMEFEEVNCQEFLIFIKGLSNVRRLALDGVCSWILDCIEKEKQLPRFRNLIQLELSASDTSQIKMLVAFLYRSPNLETLVFPLGVGVYSTYDSIWKELEQASHRLTKKTPRSCRFNLKRILVYYYHGWEVELIYIKFLLKYAFVLEELIVFSVVPTTLKSTLHNIPRASRTCSIQLLPDGDFVRKSLCKWPVF